MKNVENLDVMMPSKGVLIHIIVKMNPAIIVAMTPALEYRLQKTVIKIAGDSVPPTPAHAQLTTRYSRESEARAMTMPTIPAMSTVSRDVATSCSSVTRLPTALCIISALAELVTTINCEFAVVMIAAKIPGSKR